MIKIPTFVETLSTECLIDTGASTEFVKRSVVLKLLEQGCFLRFYKTTKPVQVTLGDSSIKSCEQIVKFNIKINGSEYQVKACILEELPFDVVLGMSFLKRYNALVDVAHRTIQLDTDVEPNVPELTCNVIYISEEVMIPAGCEILLSCVHDVGSSFTTGFVSSYPPLQDRHQVVIGKGIVEVGNEIRVVVSNMSGRHRHLPSGTIVGNVSSFEQDNWTTTLNIFDVNENFDEGNENLLEAEKLFASLRLEDSAMTVEQLERMKKLISRYQKRFLPKGKAVGQTNMVGHSIDIDGARPINQAPYRAGPRERTVIEEQTEEMLKNNIIRASKSPWASPVVLVNKKDGSIRFCVNYQKLNKVTIRDVYPLPRIDDSLNCLGRAKYFSTFDLASGYWQIPMAEEDKEKTAFVSHVGLYEFNTMPFGLNNAPATFQRFMDQCLAGLKWKTVLVYIDDIICFSETFEQHLKDLEEVFHRLEVSQLTLKPTKCFICRKRLEYLGHEVSAEGISPNSEKVDAIKKITIPKNVTDIKSFLGICGYYRKFISNFAQISTCLLELTKLDCPFIWTDRHQVCFDELKVLLTSAPILAHPNFDHPFIVQTDACD